MGFRVCLNHDLAYFILTHYFLWYQQNPKACFPPGEAMAAEALLTRPGGAAPPPGGPTPGAATSPGGGRRAAEPRPPAGSRTRSCGLRGTRPRPAIFLAVSRAADGSRVAPPLLPLVTGESCAASRVERGPACSRRENPERRRFLAFPCKSNTS